MVLLREVDAQQKQGEGCVLKYIAHNILLNLIWVNEIKILVLKNAPDFLICYVLHCIVKVTPCAFIW